MYKLRTLLTWGLLAVAAHVMGVNVVSVTVDPIEITPGESANLVINMANTETDLTAYQLSVYLPDGVTIQKKSNGKYAYTANADRHDGAFTITVKDAADGSVLIACFSADKDVLTGTNGELISLPLDVASTVTTSLQGSIKNMEFTNTSSQATKPAGITFNITLATTPSVDVTETSYTVNEIAGGQTLHTTQGTANVGDEVMVPYHAYNVVDGVLYNRAQTSKQFRYPLTIDEEDKVVNLEYTQTETENVVFLKEAEDIEGMAACIPVDEGVGNNAEVRSSNAASAYPADGNVEFVTLPAGIYQLTAVMYNSFRTDGDMAGTYSDWNFLANGEPIATLTNSVSNYDEKTSEPFTLTEETTLAIQKRQEDGRGRLGLDLIYIVKTGDWQPDTTPAVEVSDISQMDNAIYIEPFTARAGDGVQIEVKLKNSQDIAAYSFDLVLPEGVTLEKNVKGKFVYTLDEDRHDDHSGTINEKDGNVYSVAVLSVSGGEMYGNDGTVITLSMALDESMEEGMYPIVINNARYSLPDGQLVEAGSTTTALTIENVIVGDVNDNGSVDIGDAVCIINHIVGKTNAVFVERAADVNGNGTYGEIGDAVSVVNIIVGKTTVQSARELRSNMLDPQ